MSKEIMSKGGTPAINEGDVRPTIGIITALPKEYGAVKVLLESQREIAVAGRGAGRRYLYGEIPASDGGKHAVVLALLPAMGNNPASSRATLLQTHFSSVQEIIMSGIAGGVPKPEDPEEHVRLGDIVVCNGQGVVQYDFDKEELEGETVKITHRDQPRPPSARLLESVKLLEAGEIEGERPWTRFIGMALERLSLSRPPDETDVLTSSTDPSVVIPHPEDLDRVSGQPRVFIGPIASANKLLKNPVKRDQLSNEFGVKAVEMEGSGIADATWIAGIGYLVVRGICDYCDKNKGNRWQKYAAVVAAAYTRALLEATPAQPPDLTIPDAGDRLEAGFTALSTQISTQTETLGAKLDNFAGIMGAGEGSAQKLTSRVAQEYTRRLDRIKEQFDKGLFKKAKTAYQEVVQDLKIDREFNSLELMSRALTGWGACEWKLENLGEAARLFEDSHSYMPEDPSRIANLAIAQMLRGDPNAALETINRSLSMKPGDDVSIQFKANILAQAKRFDDAIAFLKESNKPVRAAFFQGWKNTEEGRIEEAEKAFREALEGDKENVEFMDHIAQCILVSRQQALSRENSLPWMLPEDARKDFEEAEQLLTLAIDKYREQEVPKRLLVALWNRSEARLELADHEGVISDCNEILKLDPEYAEAYSKRARAEMRSQNFVAATKSWERYVEMTGGEKGSRRELANCYFFTGDIGKAKPLLLKELEGEITEADLRFVELAIDVFDRDLDYDQAEALVARVENQFPDSAIALMVRADHLQNTGQPSVESLLREALAKADDWVEQSLVMKLANLLYDEGRFAEALPFYEQVTDESEKNPLSYRRLVCLANSGKLKEALDYAAKLRGDVETDVEISPLEAQIHRSLGELRPAARIYLNLYHKTGGKVDYLVEHGLCLYRLGEPESAVRAFDQIKHRVTKTEDLLALAHGYSTVGKSATAIELGYKALEQESDNPDVHLAYIGLFFEMRRAGDKAEIEEKYAKKFEDVRDNFNRRFPEVESFKMINIKENPNFLRDFLMQRDPSIEETLNEYKTNQLALSTKAFLRGRRLFDIWLALTSMPEPGLRGSVVTFEELQRENKAIAEASEAVIDLLALYDLCRIGRQDLLAKIFEKTYIHQAVLDEVIDTINDESLYAESGRSYAVVVNGELYRREVPAEAIRENVAFLEQVKEFIKTRCEPTGLVELVKEADEELVEALGRSASYTTILALQKQIPLLSDDGLLRKYLLHARGAEGFSTQTLLTYAAEQGHLTKEELFEAFLQLLRLQYRFISVNDEFLAYCARKDAYSSGENFSLALAELGRPEAPVQWIASNVGNFLKELWLSSIPDVTRSLILDEVLAVITKGHDPQKMLRSLLAYLHPKMKLISHYYMDIYRQVKFWASVAHPEVRL
jgi:nucleoside phosphorylase/Flp pilus assembly protein TadD/predicted nucleic acid-binding protein